MTHTLGPWQIDTKETDPNIIEGVYIQSDGAVIAKIYEENPCSECDARLIAAAPDMLVILQRLNRALDYLPPNNGLKVDKLQADIDAILNKIKG